MVTLIYIQHITPQQCCGVICYTSTMTTRNFPHLQGATDFPQDNIHVYEQYSNTFDYGIWTPNTKIKLCHVNYYDDYRDTVKFKDNDARDAYFDNLDGQTVSITSNMYIHRADTDGIKLPVPYATLQQYNYIVVDMTADILKSDLQDKDAQTRYHYFITDIKADAPNTTNVTLVRDVWTDYINDVTISYLMLNRGHAPLTTITPAKLLTNPIEYSAPLLAPDVNYSNGAGRVTSAHVTNLTQGAKYICFALTCTPQQLSSMATQHGYAVSNTNPSYSNNDTTVREFAYGAGGIDITHVRGQGTAYATDNNIPNNTTVYAVASEQVTSAYIDTIMAQYPHIANNIVACFVVSESMITKHNTSVRVHDVDWTVVTGAQRTLEHITLSPDDFDIPAEYKNIAKLYVSPYAQLIITDNYNNTTTVNIEDFGQLSVQTLTSISYPLLNCYAFVDGVQSNTSTSITVTQLDKHNTTSAISNADLITTLHKYNIPTYALQRRAVDYQRAQSYNTQVANARSNNIVSAENTALSANTTLSNTQRSNETNIDNTQRSNDTSVANTKRSNDTSVANTQRSNATNVSNTQRTNNAMSANTASANALNTAVANNTKQTATDSTNKSNDKIANDNKDTNNKISGDALQDGNILAATKEASTDAVAMSNLSSNVGAIVGGVATAGITAAATIATGGSAALVAAGVAGTVASTGVSVGVSGYNASIAISKNQDLYWANEGALLNKTQLATKTNTSLTNRAINYATDITNLHNTLLTNNTNAQNSAKTTQTNNIISASNANAQASASTGNANAQASASTSNANAQASATTSNTNAQASANTSNTNAQNTRDTSVTIAHRNMLQSRSNIDAQYADYYNQSATPIGRYTGDAMLDDINQRALSVKVQTQSLSALQQAGAYFTRYGIASNQLYSNPNLTPCKYYTYWRSDDVMLTARIQAQYVHILRGIFSTGVTVWRNPDDINNVNVYNNI